MPLIHAEIEGLPFALQSGRVVYVRERVTPAGLMAAGIFPGALLASRGEKGIPEQKICPWLPDELHAKARAAWEAHAKGQKVDTAAQTWRLCLWLIVGVQVGEAVAKVEWIEKATLPNQLSPGDLAPSDKAELVEYSLRGGARGIETGLDTRNLAAILADNRFRSWVVGMARRWSVLPSDVLLRWNTLEFEVNAYLTNVLADEEKKAANAARRRK